MGKKNRKKGWASEAITVGNLTLLNYADAPKSSERIVKSKSSLKQHIAESTSIDHFDVDVESQDEEEPYSDKLKKSKPNISNLWSGEIEYPFDLWDILSNYVLPETLCIYARLCQGAYSSVNRVTFWLNLYEKFAVTASRQAFAKTGCESLPERFREEYVNRYCQGNLRIKVIRALFYAYEPFRGRLTSVKSLVDPHSIIGFTCLSAWTARKMSMFKFCFKLTSKPTSISAFQSQRPPNEFGDDWEAEIPEADVSVSQEESCVLLQLDCDAFSLLPGFIPGLKILDLLVTSSGDGFRYQKVTLNLGPPHVRPGKDSTGRSTASLTIGNIMAIRLLNWYHPLYSS